MHWCSACAECRYVHFPLLVAGFAFPSKDAQTWHSTFLTLFFPPAGMSIILGVAEGEVFIHDAEIQKSALQVSADGQKKIIRGKETGLLTCWCASDTLKCFDPDLNSGSDFKNKSSYFCHLLQISPVVKNILELFMRNPK